MLYNIHTFVNSSYLGNPTRDLDSASQRQFRLLPVRGLHDTLWPQSFDERRRLHRIYL